MGRESLRQLQQAYNDAVVALSGAENQLAACIERVKEARIVLEHDELIYNELMVAKAEMKAARVVKAREYEGVRRSLIDIKQGLAQRRRNLGAARDAVDRVEDERDELISKVAQLKEKLAKTKVVVPWIKWKNSEKR